jgi:mono/diheme cytochrome c family protein
VLCWVGDSPVSLDIRDTMHRRRFQDNLTGAVRAAGWLALVLCPCGVSSAEDSSSPGTVDFAREVYPLLRRVCSECHGHAKQEGGLRLDRREAALRGGDNGAVIVPGKPDESELVRRISLPKGHDEAMPAKGEPLAASQVERIRRWIEQGARWPDDARPENHWAYVKPVRPTLPKVRNGSWPRNAVDRFILARLEQEGLSPSREAGAATLVRRVYLDLTGLPPSPAEVDAFLQDCGAAGGKTDAAALNAAYERLVDRLLASPPFGVRWARPWLDYAHYADSHGFQRDDLRDVWAYRDWVVEAINRDMPFDQFTVEQLAGDLVPGAGDSQRIATGFLRNAPCNVEAGSEPEETRVNQVFDRVNTVATVWLGATMECCQCHDHKYDPLTMRDFYGLFAIVNNTAIEADRANPKVPGSIRFLGPEMELADEAMKAERKRLAEQAESVETQLGRRAAKLREADAAFEAELLQAIAAAPQEHVLEISEFDSLGGATHEVLADKSVLLSGEAPDRDTYTATVKTNLTGIRAIKLEALTDPSLPGNGPGRGDAQRPNFVLHSFAVTASPATGGEGKAVKFARASASFSQQKYGVAGAIDDDPKTAWAINPKFHEPHWAVFETAEPIGAEGGTVLTFRLEQNFGGSRTIGRLRLSAITGSVGGQAVPANVVEAVRTPTKDRTAAQRKALADYRLGQDAEYQRWQKEKARLDGELTKVKLPTTLVMQELAQPRPAAIFLRGNYKTPGETVEPNVPAVFPPLDEPPEGRNRLALARWLASRENPVAARVTVNRFWAEIFGHGLVTTPEDFGIRGDPPTHPELLDHLAVEFMEGGWSMKKLLRTIVLSATYRQASAVTPELLARDDRNVLYARGPRFRMDAEMVRDNALSIAGLLSLKQGGPPIRPYQPEGLWIKVGGQRYDYVVSPGDEKYRRGLYVVWKRAAPYPSFVTFDAAGRLACRVARPRSNTPLQALTLLNDPVYVEAAMAFARRVLTEKQGATDEERLRHAFRWALVRSPSAAELAVLKTLLADQREAGGKDADEAKRFVGQFELPAGVSPAEFGGWYAVAAALLNLDETITKN